MKIKYDRVTGSFAKNTIETIYFDSENLIEKNSEKMGPHFTVVSDCKKWIGVSTNGTGIHYVYENK